MEKQWMEDSRKIPDETMSYIRKIAIKAIKENNISPEIVAKVLDISRSSIYEWINRFDKGGYDALDTRKAPGNQPIITPFIESWLEQTVLSSTPETHGYDTNLWTCKILADLLKTQFNIDVYPSTVHQHLKNIGLSYQKPDYKPIEQNNDEVEHFLNEKFPRIQKLAEKIEADIYFEDESRVDLNQHSGRTWGAIGKTPEIKVTEQRGKYNVLSVINNNGKLRFSIKDKNINSDVFIDFLKQLLRDRDKPLILLIDRVSFHKSKKVRNFVRSHRKQLRIFFLPKYSPELNPTEQVWNEIKNNQIERQPVKNKFDLKKRTMSALRSLQKNYDRVKSFFDIPETQYASA